MKIKVLITTYKRPDLLNRLLSQIERETKSSGFDVSVSIAEDKIGGKPNYQNVINEQWKAIKADPERHDYYIQLPDDFEIVKDFFTKSIEAFKAIKDNRKICLNLFTDESRIGKTNWTGFQPQIVNFGKHRFFLTQWNDLCFIANRNFFEALDFTINPINASRWQRDPKLSSGVGEQISHRLLKGDFNLYQVRKSLCKHGNHPSVMNPEERKEKPLTEQTLEPIIAGMATMPSRLACLPHAINSVLPYVDELNIAFNGFTEIPVQFLPDSPKIKAFITDNSRGDAEKFAKVPDYPAFFFSLDDDLIYPNNYIWELVNRIRQSRKEGKRIAFGVHGKVMKPRPIESYYKGASVQYHCKSSLPDDVTCNLIGTGTAAFHTSDLKVDISDFKTRNMADVWFALLCEDQGVQMRVISRPNEWIKLSRKINHHTQTIYAVNSKSLQADKTIAKIYNEGNREAANHAER